MCLQRTSADFSVNPHHGASSSFFDAPGKENHEAASAADICEENAGGRFLKCRHKPPSWRVKKVS